MRRGGADYVEGAPVGRRIHIYAVVFGCEVASNILGCHLVTERSEWHHIENVFGGTVKLSRVLGFWRRNRSALERKINNLWSVQGAE